VFDAPLHPAQKPTSSGKRKRSETASDPAPKAPAIAGGAGGKN
jgi:hypothetical protein